MVNKMELNNCIITLRGQVKRAKLRSITKLTKKIRSFEHGKKKNPENKKLDTKIRKFMEEIQVLKEIQKVNNVKKLFAFNKDVAKIMAQVDATATDRAMAKILYMNEFLQKSILAAKKKFSLRDDDEEWVKELFTMGKHKKKALKKKNATDSAESANEESPKKKTKVKKDTNDTPAGNVQKKPKKEVKKERKDSTSSQESPQKKAKKERKDSAGSQEEKPSEDVKVPSSPKKVKKEKKNQPKNEDKSNKAFKMNNKSKNIQKNKGNAKNFAKNVKKDFKKFNGDSKPHPGKDSKFKRPQNGPPAKFQPGGKMNNRGQKGGKGQDHPSWEAKKKQKPTIAKFQGKKTKLGD